VGLRLGFSLHQQFLPVSSLSAPTLISFRGEHQDAPVNILASDLHQTSPRAHEMRNELYLSNEMALDHPCLFVLPIESAQGQRVTDFERGSCHKGQGRVGTLSPIRAPSLAFIEATG
jgi:hypothetical protein